MSEDLGGGYGEKTVDKGCATAAAGNDVTICNGSSTVIATHGVSGYSYIWSPDTGLNNATLAQPTANPTQTTTYTLSVIPLNLLKNGDFESGNTGFSTDYLLHPNGLEESTFGRYAITTNPSSINSWCNTGDHTTGSSNMLIADCSQDVSKRIWYQTMSVSQNTTYYFSGFVYTVGEPSVFGT